MSARLRLPSGTSGIDGVITPENRLGGSTPGDFIGSGGITPLVNGNYLVGSPGGDNATTADTGAATWGNGTTGVHGVVSTANSLVGSNYSDQAGVKITALPNGNYVVKTQWNPTSDYATGAVTWADGNTGIVGPISATNSSVGTHAYDGVGESIKILANGNYVVSSRQWSARRGNMGRSIIWRFGCGKRRQ